MQTGGGFPPDTSLRSSLYINLPPLNYNSPNEPNPHNPNYFSPRNMCDFKWKPSNGQIYGNAANLNSRDSTFNTDNNSIMNFSSLPQSCDHKTVSSAELHSCKEYQHDSSLVTSPETNTQLHPTSVSDGSVPSLYSGSPSSQNSTIMYQGKSINKSNSTGSEMHANSENNWSNTQNNSGESNKVNSSFSRKPYDLPPLARRRDILNEFAELSIGPNSPLYCPSANAIPRLSMPNTSGQVYEWWKSGPVNEFLHSDKPPQNLFSPLVGWINSDSTNNVFKFDDEHRKNFAKTQRPDFRYSYDTQPSWLCFAPGSKLQITHCTQNLSDNWIEVSSSFTPETDPSYVLFKESFIYRGGLRVVNIETHHNFKTPTNTKTALLQLKSLDENMSSFILSVLSPVPLQFYVRDRGLCYLTANMKSNVMDKPNMPRLLKNDIICIPPGVSVHSTSTIPLQTMIPSNIPYPHHSNEYRRDDSVMSDCNMPTSYNYPPYLHSSSIKPNLQKNSRYVDMHNNIPDSNDSACQQEMGDNQKRPMNGFMLFAKNVRLQMINANPGKDNRFISVLLGQKWRELPSTEREKYSCQAKELAAKRLLENPLCWKRKNQIRRRLSKKR